MPNIKKLSEHVTNLIAAGEVIENSASVVKELVENSIDAGAKNIIISLVESGINEIRVLDDGCGMDTTDVELAVLPHTTSKIQDEKDLFSIQTLGFRGEALASIVAVSNFRIITSRDGHQGVMYSLKGGMPTTMATMAHDKGTEIIVKNLFFNTPARLQNLQNPAIELSYVTEYVSKIALSRPDISFILSNNDKEILHTYGRGVLLECIMNLYGNEIAKSMVKLFDNDGIFKISGFISNLSVTRSSKKDIHIIVNGRMIRNQKIVNAVVAGYGTLLMHGRYPVSVLTIEVDPGMIDVNVHPAKLEVRFSEEERLLQLLTTSVQRVLKSVDLSIQMKVDEDEEDKKYINQDSYDEEMKDDSSNPSWKNETTDEITQSFEMDNEAPEHYEYHEEKKETIVETPKEKFVQQQYNLFNENTEESIHLKYQLPKMYYIGQLFGTYILAQSDNEFYLIDQHAAAERINYEKLLNELEKEDSIGYDLLFPFNLQFSLSDAMQINEHMDEINHLGIVLDDFGGGTFTVRRIPIWIFRGSEQEFVEEIITQIISNNKKSKLEFLDNLAKQLACKKSIKGNEFHNALEIDYLLEDLSKAKNPFTCPHGRPVIVKFSKEQIEKWFKRIV